MWTVVQVVICLGFLVLAAFWAGRRLGQRRFYQMQEEMRALELSFKNLMDDMEMVSAHNMKVLETRTEEIKELMTIADRKCLYVNDLLKEMDDTSASLRLRNINGTSPVTSIEAGADRKMHRELQGAYESLSQHFAQLADRVAELEENQTVFETSSVVDLVKIETGKQLKALGLPSLPVSHENLPGEACLVAGGEKMAERVVALRPSRENISEMVKENTATVRPNNVKELRIASIDEGARLPAVAKKTDMEVARVLPRPPVGFPVTEVLKMYERGVTLPQIARNLNMSKSEIELILKLYGGGMSMRKIV